MHAKYQVAILKSEKVMANVKVFFGRTDRVTDTDGQFNCCMPPYREAYKLFFWVGGGGYSVRVWWSFIR